MKILQLNVWSGRLFNTLGILLEQEKPDIICFQEGVSMPVVMPCGFFRSVEEVASRYGMHIADAPLFGFQLATQQAQFGNYVLSKLPITDCNITFTYGQYEANFDFLTEDYKMVNVLHAGFDRADQPLHVLTIHGFHVPQHKNGNEETISQCQFLLGYIRKLTGDVILTGDFNLAPDSDSIKILDKELHNLTKESELETTRTFLTPKTETCDYIFVNDQVKVKNFYASDIIASDHKALVMEFE